MKSESKNNTNLKKQSRVGFLITGFILAVIFLLKGRKKERRPTIIKFLSEDGRLVEVDVSKLPATRRQASTEEIQNWIKR